VPDCFTVLLIGGSQGARRLNEVIVQALPDLWDCQIQALHQTGVKNLDEVLAATGRHGSGGSGYCAKGFLTSDEVSLAYRAADIIVCRGGISTLSEVMLNGLPAIVVPLPTAYADHQTANARVLERAGAARLVPESGLSASTLVRDLSSLRMAPNDLANMAQQSRLLSRPDAADEVAKIVLGL